MIYSDTIVAIATPPGEGGIGIVRLSGNDALPIAQRLFHPHTPAPFRSHRVRYGHIVDTSDGSVVDEVLAVYMQAPRSFTREDVVELSCHGGPVPLQRTLDLALREGARFANPGEFTMRAFLNGRIDLSQAEATLDVIRARTSTGLALAQAQLGGWLAHEVRRLRATLLNVLAFLTVTIDFPEDEVEPEEWLPDLYTCLQAVKQLHQSADQGMLYRQGVRAVLVGRPNVGKSSLLNMLLRTNRAIVTPIPGTTRDTLEETANLGGIPVVLTDTAGITESNDPVERLGIERSREALAQADLALLVLDRSELFSEDDMHIAMLTMEKPTLVVWNKADMCLPQGGTGTASKDECPTLPLAHPSVLGTVATSVVTGAGLDRLVDTLVQVLGAGAGGRVVVSGEAHLVTNPRHRDALGRAVAALHAATSSHEQGMPTDLLAGDVTTALSALGEIVGETVTDDLLDTIFSRFCIGK